MKTTLKTAKFIFKTAVTRCVATNAVAVFCISVANVAVGGAEIANWLWISAVCCAKMAVGGVVAGFLLFGFFMIAVRMGRSEICKFQFL